MPDFPLFPNVKFSTVITESDYGPLWSYVNHMGPTCTEVLQQMCDLVGANWRGMFKDFSGADLNSPFAAKAEKLRDTSYECSLEVFGNHMQSTCMAHLNQFDLICLHASCKMFIAPRKEATAQANFMVTQQQRRLKRVFIIFHILTQDACYRHKVCETPWVNC